MFKIQNKIFTLWVLFFSISCGTIIGNGFRDPTTPSYNGTTPDPIDDSEFIKPIDEYNQSTLNDCSSFSERSTIFSVDVGRQCIIEADSKCFPSKYLYDKTNADGSRFVSYVSVKLDSENPDQCLVRVHTVSNVPPSSINKIRTCEGFTNDVIPELACNIFEE